MRNVLFALIGLCGYALFSGWTNYNSFVEAVESSCNTTGGSPEQCSCFADAMSEEVSIVTFAGIGGFTPFFDEDKLNEATVATALSCQA
jgi:hypothetical protein